LSGVVFAVAAETLNILVPDQHFIQWVLFILAVVCFILAITAWDRRKRSRGDGP
jgi:hypothetical protein